MIASDYNNQSRNTLAPPHMPRGIGRFRKRRIRSGVKNPFGMKRADRCGRREKLGYSEKTYDSEI